MSAQQAVDVIQLSPDGPEMGGLCLVAAAAGILSHLGFYSRGYHYRQAFLIVLTHLSAGLILVVLFARESSWASGLRRGAAVWASYHAALSSSIIIYRIWFHPLRNFPAPLGASVTKLHNVIWAQGGKIHEHHTRWAQKLGTIVRIAPNELLLSSVDGMLKVHSGSKVTKHDSIYDYIDYKGHRNLDSIADMPQHRARRKVWERALNSSTWPVYEQNIRQVAHDWMDVMKAAAANAKVLDSTLYGKLIALDNMGLLGYSSHYKTVKAGRELEMLHLLTVTLGKVGQLCMDAGLIAIARSLGLGKEQEAFERLSNAATEKRLEEMEKQPLDGRIDLMKHFIEDYKLEQPTSFLHINDVYSDSQAIMVAGADSLGCAISFAFYHLARERTVREKLRAELAPAFGATVAGEFTDKDLNELPYLEAVVMESLRVFSPICNNGPRVFTEDVEVDGMIIPKGTTVITGIHTIQRNPKHFVKPDEFIPERWTDRPELVLDRRAWHPFIIGPFNCVGKRVALITIRMIIAYTVYHYDLEFAPGEDGTSITRESVNALVLKPGPCKCIFTEK